MKKEVLSILGSTGSIGNNTVDVVSNNLNKFSVYGLTAKNNINLLLKQSHLVKPKAVAIQKDCGSKIEKLILDKKNWGPNPVFLLMCLDTLSRRIE